MAKAATEKTGEQIKTIEEQTGFLKGPPESLVEINKPMIVYEKEGKRLTGTEKEETHYVNLDRGINYDAIEDFPKVSAPPLRRRLRIRSVISVHYHYITVLCPFNLLICFKCYNTV